MFRAHTPVHRVGAAARATRVHRAAVVPGGERESAILRCGIDTAGSRGACAAGLDAHAVEGQGGGHVELERRVPGGLDPCFTWCSPQHLGLAKVHSLMVEVWLQPTLPRYTYHKV